MKKIALIATAAIMALSSTLAVAQPYGAYSDHRDGAYGDHRDYRDNDRRDNDRDGDRRYDRRYDGHYDGYRYQRGERFAHYNQRAYYIDNYWAYNLPAPRPGYRYYRSDNGDVVMVAIASGIIGLVIGNALSNGANDHGYYRH